MARHELDARRCTHCGRDRGDCSNPATGWYEVRTVCYSTMARLAFMRAYHAKHKDADYHDGSFKSWGKYDPEHFPYHRDDGVTITVTDTEPTKRG